MIDANIMFSIAPIMKINPNRQEQHFPLFLTYGWGFSFSVRAVVDIVNILNIYFI
jgi:hypothetical protein